MPAGRDGRDDASDDAGLVGVSAAPAGRRPRSRRRASGQRPPLDRRRLQLEQAAPRQAGRPRRPVALRQARRRHAAPGMPRRQLGQQRRWRGPSAARRSLAAAELRRRRTPVVVSSTRRSGAGAPASAAAATRARCARRVQRSQAAQERRPVALRAGAPRRRRPRRLATRASSADRAGASATADPARRVDRARRATSSTRSSCPGGSICADDQRRRRQVVLGDVPARGATWSGGRSGPSRADARQHRLGLARPARSSPRAERRRPRAWRRPYSTSTASPGARSASDRRHVVGERPPPGTPGGIDGHLDEASAPRHRRRAAQTPDAAVGVARVLGRDDGVDLRGRAVDLAGLVDHHVVVLGLARQLVRRVRASAARAASAVSVSRPTQPRRSSSSDGGTTKMSSASGTASRTARAPWTSILRMASRPAASAVATWSRGVPYQLPWTSDASRSPPRSRSSLRTPSSVRKW